MSTTISSDGLEPRRKKALYHAWHRGTKEMDILLGEFADAHVATLSPADLGDLEILMDETDRDLFSWILGSEPTPEARQTSVFAALVAFHSNKYEGAEVTSAA
jgi:antitoxin CptB